MLRVGARASHARFAVPGLCINVARETLTWQSAAGATKFLIGVQNRYGV